MPAFPQPPVLGFSFTSFSTDNPTGQQPGVSLDAEFNRGYAAIASILSALAVSLNADGTLNSAAVAAAYTAAEGGTQFTGTNLADAPSALSAELAQAWAEYMPDQLPASTLAGTGITGDHYSSRYWANQAATIIATQVAAVEAQIAAWNATIGGLIDSGGFKLVLPLPDLDLITFNAIAAQLPTTEPPGGLWNNGGVVCVSTQGGSGALVNMPTVEPAPGGGLWNNGGVVCIA